MPTIKAHKAIKTLLLCTLLCMPKPIKPMLHRTLDLTTSQLCAIVSFASFCIGAIVCALINKYCYCQTVIQPKKNNSEKIETKKKMVTSLQNINTTLTDIHSAKSKEKNILEELHKRVEALELYVQTTTEQTKIIQEKKSQLKEELHSFYKTNENFMPLVLTLYCLHYKRDHIKEIKEYKTESNNIKVDLLSNNLENNV